MKKQVKENVFEHKAASIIVLIVAAFSVLGTILLQSGRVNDENYIAPSAANCIFWVAVGLVLMFLCSLVNIKKLQKWVPVIGLTAVVLLFLLLTPMGVSVYGARRWLRIGNFSIQPSELVIFAHILLTARMVKYFHQNGTKYQLMRWTWGMASLVGFAVLVIISNMNPFVLILGITFLVTLVFAEMVPFHLTVIGIGGISMICSIAMMLRQNDEYGYRMTRLNAWLNPYSYADGYGYQAVQQLEAVKSGGWFGKGFAKGELSQQYPGFYTDGLFAVLCEEFGWIAAILLVIAVIVLLYQIYQILKRAIQSEDSFAAALVMGILAHIGLCSVIYIARNLNLLPNGSGRFPFINCRGLSEIIVYCEIGLVLAVNKCYNKSSVQLFSKGKHRKD